VFGPGSLAVRSLSAERTEFTGQDRHEGTETRKLKKEMPAASPCLRVEACSVLSVCSVRTIIDAYKETAGIAAGRFSLTVGKS
jgi:hypothetical protein